mmetsp:Transcript_16982/g.26413  ORF Transcript_16982/g.26413 Transcript_16982/m.26413 type:complete len:225 (-) Transcript_16982:32-706(-)
MSKTKLGSIKITAAVRQSRYSGQSRTQQTVGSSKSSSANETSGGYSLEVPNIPSIPMETYGEEFTDNTVQFWLVVTTTFCMAHETKQTVQEIDLGHYDVKDADGGKKANKVKEVYLMQNFNTLSFPIECNMMDARPQKGWRISVKHTEDRLGFTIGATVTIEREGKRFRRKHLNRDDFFRWRDAFRKAHGVRGGFGFVKNNDSMTVKGMTPTDVLETYWTPFFS